MSPPPEIAADPARYAIWRQQRDEAEYGMTSVDEERTFSAAGCGHSGIIRCAYGISVDPSGNRYLGWNCLPPNADAAGIVVPGAVVTIIRLGGTASDAGVPVVAPPPSSSSGQPPGP